MISPVTIYVPVPAGVAGRPGAASRLAAEAGGSKSDPVRAVERIVPGDRRGRPDAKFHAVFDDRAAEGLAARRRVHPQRRDEPADGGSGAGDFGDARARNEAATFQAPPRPSPQVGRALTAPLDGPGRPRAIDAVYRTIESFGGDIAQRGAIFDFSV